MAYNPQNPNGQTTSANSAPVVIANDQSPIPTTVSGVATSANQATEIANLATIATNTTGASTAANQATANGYLATIAAQTPLSDSLWLDSAGVYFVYRDTGSGAFAKIRIDTGASYSPVGDFYPVSMADFQTSGSITTQNLVPAGTATTGSAVSLGISGKGTITIQVTGTYTGDLSPQVTTNNTDWVTQGGTSLQNMATGAYSATIPSGATGIWQVEVNGHAQFRITALAAVTGSATITMRGAAGTSQVTISGVATAANQTTGNTSLATIATNSATAATSANQTNGSQKAQIVDGSGNVITSTTRVGKQGLDVTLGSAATPGAVAPNWTDVFGGVDPSGNAQQIQLDESKNLKVAVQGTSTVSGTVTANLGTLNGAATAANQSTEIGYLTTIATNTGAQATDFQSTGTITALNGTVSITGQGVYTMTASITGTWTGTLIFEGQTTDLNWNALPANILASTVPYSTVSSTTTNGVYIVTGGGFLNLRVRASSAITGTVNVALDGSLSQQTIYSGQMGTWSNQISDGTTPAKKAALTTVPAVRTANALVVTPAQQAIFRTTFASTIASGVDSNFFSVIQSGTGQTISQSSGNLVITAGTTANSEQIIRSTSSFSGSMLARIQSILSQRIANNNFYVELVDVIGDSLATTVNSATSITVTIPNNPFTSVNVGQSIYIGAVQNISATAVPGRYAIASVSGNNVTFTVAGWPASGSGTVSLFGWNYYQLTYTGTTATNVNYDAQRRGWNSGTTTATINTTASPGHMAIMMNNDGTANLADQLIASVAGTVQITQRASRVVNLPEENTMLYLQIRSLNGSTAPASTTTWTLGMASVENYSASAVVINDVKAVGTAAQVPVAVTNTPAVTVSSGTVTTVSTVTSITSNQLAIPGIIADVASAALTTTTTTATLTPTFGSSYSVTIPVTVVSGTTPTLDIEIQESDDTGTNWVAVYDFPRITSTGFYRSPQLPMTGNRIRYVQTVGGTTPSFTRAINRLQASTSVTPYRQIVDRTIVLTTLSSTTASLTTGGAKNMQLVINIGTTTLAPAVQLQGSDDGGITWYLIGTPLTAVASSTVQLTVNNMTSQLIRGIVTTAGTSTVAGYVLIRAF